MFFFLKQRLVFSEALPNSLDLGALPNYRDQKNGDRTLGRDASTSMARFVQVQIENQLNGITIISPCKFRRARLDQPIGFRWMFWDPGTLGISISFLPKVFLFEKSPKKR